MWVVSCPSGRFTPIVCGRGKPCVKETASGNCCGFYSDLIFTWKRYLIKILIFGRLKFPVDIVTQLNSCD